MAWHMELPCRARTGGLRNGFRAVRHRWGDGHGVEPAAGSTHSNENNVDTARMFVIIIILLL